MLYSASWTDLKNIIQWLRGRDESQWEERTKELSDTITILKELSRPIPRPDRSPIRSREPDLLPSSEAVGINDAMPHLRGMLVAMHVRNRQEALDYGEAALSLLPTG